MVPSAPVSATRPPEAKMPALEEPSFWACAATLEGAITLRIAADLGIVGLVATTWVVLQQRFVDLCLSVGPVEIAGGALGVMLVFRSNVGYDRWYEGRRLWGQITNTICHLVQSGLAYGPKDGAWREAWVTWCCVFGHACRVSLRSEAEDAAFARLIGPAQTQQMLAAAHMPTYVNQQLASLLAQYAKDPAAVQPMLFNIEQCRLLLTDAIGGCERISSTPLPRVYLLKIRRFIALYLLLLPAALVDRIGWATPMLTMLVAYPVLGLDRIANQLQSPFSTSKLNHLPLDAMCEAIERRSKDMWARAGVDAAQQQAASGATARKKL